MSGWAVATFDEIPEIVKDRAKLDDEVNVLENYIGMYGYEPGIIEKIDHLFRDVPREGRVLIVHANDTTDSGVGTLYDLDGMEKIEYREGYEGARGHDLKIYFNEEYDMDGRVVPP